MHVDTHTIHAPVCVSVCVYEICTHAHARTHACMHARTHARTRTLTHAHSLYTGTFGPLNTCECLNPKPQTPNPKPQTLNPYTHSHL